MENQEQQPPAVQEVSGINISAGSTPVPLPRRRRWIRPLFGLLVLAALAFIGFLTYQYFTDPSGPGVKPANQAADASAAASLPLLRASLPAWFPRDLPWDSAMAEVKVYDSEYLLSRNPDLPRGSLAYEVIYLSKESLEKTFFDFKLWVLANQWKLSVSDGPDNKSISGTSGDSVITINLVKKGDAVQVDVNFVRFPEAVVQ